MKRKKNGKNDQAAIPKDENIQALPSADTPEESVGRSEAPRRHAHRRKRSRKKVAMFATDITPFVMFALALLAETCIILNSHAGVVGSAVHGVFYGIFGPVSHAVAIGALLLAFFYTDLKLYGSLRFKLILTSVFMVVLCTAYSLIAQNGMEGVSFSFADFYASGEVGESGGVLGCFFAYVFSAILTGTVAAVVFTVISLALLTLCLGKTHIGIWRAFFRYEYTPKKAEDKPSAEPERRAADAPDVAATARRIDTVIVDTMSEAEAPSAASATEVTELPSSADVSSGGTSSAVMVDDEEEFFEMTSSESPSSEDGGFDVLDFDITEGSHTVTTVDFGEEEHLRENYRPNDLMSDFGFEDEKYGEKPQKPDVYDENPAPKEKKPYVPPKRIDMGSPNAYSPFANPLMTFDEFKKQGKGTSQPKQTSQQNTAAYSPFSDPVRSMNEPKRSGEIAPQLYIATDSKDKWESEQAEKDQPQQEIEIPAPEEIIATVTEPEEEEDDIPFAPSLERTSPAPQRQATARTPAFAPQSASAGVNSASAGVNSASKEVRDSFGIPTAALDDPSAPASTFEDEPSLEAPVTAPSAPTVTAAPKTAAAAPAPSASPAKPDIKAISALRGNTQIDDGVAAPEAADPDLDDGDDEEYEDEQGINFYTYKHKRYPNYVPPTIDLLDPPAPPVRMSEEEIYEIQAKLLEKLSNFKVDASLTGYSIGPSITRYELTPGPGVKSKQIMALADDIGLALQSEVRIFNVPDKSVVGVEVPNKKASKVSLRSLIDTPEFKSAKSKITVCVGVTVSGKPIYMNIDDMPHVLVAGQTKSGKSVAINCMLISLVYRASPDEVQLILIDPKRVELSVYSDLPHMVMPVIDDMKQAAAALKWAVAEMDRRYKILGDMRLRNRDEYYALKDENPNFEYMPQIVIVIDELADLMLLMREHVEELINRLAAMARACGIHLIIGTQRPSADIVTGLIKANIPSRIAFKVANQVDSRIILGSGGAEKLLGRGDMLYYPTGSNQVRAQGAFVDTPEIKRILKFIMDKNGGPQYNPEILYTLQTETDKLNKNGSQSKKSDEEADDVAIDSSDIDFDYICKATELVINLGKATTNVIQRHLKVGFNKAANITDQLEELGFISKSQGSSRPREVLVTMQQFLEWKNANQR